jgi:hypothetical protein
MRHTLAAVLTGLLSLTTSASFAIFQKRAMDWDKPNKQPVPE